MNAADGAADRAYVLWQGGRSYRQIAEALGVTLTQARKLVEQGRAAVTIGSSS